MDITVGQVSGIIAFGVALVQIIIPTAIVLLLVGILKAENSIVTWTAASRSIQSSYFPLLFASSPPNLTDRRVLILTYLTPVALVLIAISGIVTPLGLSDTIRPARSVTTAAFVFAKDDSPISLGTPMRSNLGFSRKCGGARAIPCPGSKTVIVTNGTGTFAPEGYDVQLPQDIIDAFAYDHTSISGSFDIQWRQVAPVVEEGVNNGEKYLQAGTRHLQTLLLESTARPIDGLVVDFENGGIAFRNHSVPQNSVNDALWTEDLLSMTPETVCVPNNLTINFRLGVAYNNSGPLTVQNNTTFLVDQGGFENSLFERPLYNHENAKADPDLYNRALQAAWTNNLVTMVYLNITGVDRNITSKVGDRFKLPDPTGRSDLAYDAILTTPVFGKYLKLIGNTVNGVSSANFSLINTLCHGATTRDAATADNVAVHCGLMYGIPVPVKGRPNTLVFEPGGEWSTPIYTCATAVKASVRTYTFKSNATGSPSVKSFNVMDSWESPELRDWGVEATDLTLDDIAPIWGLTQSKSPLVTTLHQQHLWIPGYNSPNDEIGTQLTRQNMPIADLHRYATAVSYRVDARMSGDLVRRLPDYSGSQDLAMYSKWQQLSWDENSAAKIINAIWTDVAANTAIGTKGADGTTREVLFHHRSVKYDFRFIVPAATVVILLLILIVLSLLLCFKSRDIIKRIKHLVTHTATGNVVTSFVTEYDVCDSGSTISRKHGARVVGLRETSVRSGKGDREATDGRLGKAWYLIE